MVRSLAILNGRLTKIDKYYALTSKTRCKSQCRMEGKFPEIGCVWVDRLGQQTFVDAGERYRSAKV